MPMLADQSGAAIPAEFDDGAQRAVNLPPIGPRPTIYSSQELLRGQREVWIEHGDQMYRLRLTSGGKLYMTK
jgi:hemin uptake protein HemP